MAQENAFSGSPPKEKKTARRSVAPLSEVHGYPPAHGVSM